MYILCGSTYAGHTKIMYGAHKTVMQKCVVGTKDEISCKYFTKDFVYIVGTNRFNNERLLNYILCTYDCADHCLPTK